jgi:hypothetical protein
MENKGHFFWKNKPISISSNIYLTLDVKEERNDFNKKSVEKVENNILPSGLYWEYFSDVQSETLIEIFNLLENNYVEDLSSNFRLSYSLDFLNWYFILILILGY